jgi:hypothetical protein
VGNLKSLESLPKAIFSASWNEPRCLTRVLTQDMRVDAQHHGWVGMAEAGCSFGAYREDGQDRTWATTGRRVLVAH